MQLSKYFPQLGQFLDSRGVENELPLIEDLVESILPIGTTGTRLRGAVTKLAPANGKSRRNSTSEAGSVTSPGKGHEALHGAGADASADHKSHVSGAGRRQPIGVEERHLLEAGESADTELGTAGVVWPSRQFMRSSGGQ